MRKIYLFLLIIISNAISAQSGKITGKIISAISGQDLPNATITLIEKSQMQVADQNGNFSFSRLAAGRYSVKCSYGGYKEKTVDSILVKDNEIATIVISLDEISLSGIVLKSTKVNAARETIASALVFRKNLANTSDFITAEQIRATPDRGASDVIKRISGATIQDDRFAIIRGLNDRYNAAFINGAPLPSTESDRKAFAFDIFPSSILDNMIIYKTATPDKTGEFGGGIIDITTKSISQKNFTSISFGGGYNSLITGKTRYYSEAKGSKDWIGIDDGSRGMPGGIPSTAVLNKLPYVQKAELAKLFGNYKWGVKNYDAGPNYNFQLSKGFNVERRRQEFLGALFSVNYRRDFTFTQGERNSYDFGTLEQRNKYTDSIYNEEVIVSALANIAIKINARNNISWKNNFSINTDNKLAKRVGYFDSSGSAATGLKESVRWYTSNQIFSSQLNGEHTIGKYKTKINWLASYARVEREIPSLSRISYSVDMPAVANPVAVFSTPPSQTSGSGTMFSSHSNENIKNVKADITQPYTFLKNSQNTLKIGGSYQVRKRNFTSRTLGLSPYDSITFDNSLRELPEDQIFLPPHLGKMKNGMGGFLLADGTQANSNYTASSALANAYIMNDQRFFRKFRLIYGVRMEQFNQKLNSIKNFSDTIRLNTTLTDFLPSVNLVYELTQKMNIRLSYAQTINRPEFRELAPFLFFDYVTNVLYEGQPTLVRAKIKNYDFRYEFFPGRAQLFSISAFYKEFSDPIEIYAVPNTTSQATYYNAKNAKAYGLEAEVRVLLSTLLGIRNTNALLGKFTLSANAAYIKSNIRIDSLFSYPASALITDRPLQGQSPYIFNGSLNFNDDKTGFSSTVSVNRIGERIFIAGTYNTASIFEMSRTVVDFQVAKFFANKIIELKLTVKDLLAQDIRFYFDFDRNNKFTEKDDRYFSTNTTPRVFTFTASYKF